MAEGKKGWVKIRRSLLEWEWYDDHNATRLLLHLILSVNYEEKKWKGLTISPGSMVLSWDTLSRSVGLTVQQTRTAMGKLIKSEEVTKTSTNRFQVVRLTKWEKMQLDDTFSNKLHNKQITIKQQSDNKQVTTTKESKEYKELKETIPAYDEFFNYALSKNKKVNQAALKMKYDSWVENGWKTGGAKPHKIKNWKTTLLNTLPWLKAPEETKFNSLAEKMRHDHGITST
jgi:hypothetical protein